MAWFKKKQKINTDHQTAATTQAPGNEELIAVLAAAVAAHMGTAPGNIVIRSWRQVSPAWRRSAREIQIYQRF